MEEADIKFERENRDGIVATGTYLFDAARRLGIEIECERTGETDFCAVEVKSGREFLSDMTKAETEQLSEERRRNGERLACQAKIVRAGEISIMTKEKVKEEKPVEEAKKEQYKKEFEEMPLEKKIASLVELEAMALGETISFVFNSPYKIFEKALDVMAEFGLKLEKEAKDATRPNEHAGEEEEEATAAADTQQSAGETEAAGAGKNRNRKKTQNN